jgi:hypothetical protein
VDVGGHAHVETPQKRRLGPGSFWGGNAGDMKPTRQVARRMVFTSRSDGELVVVDFSLISFPSR